MKRFLVNCCLGMAMSLGLFVVIAISLAVLPKDGATRDSLLALFFATLRPLEWFFGDIGKDYQDPVLSVGIVAVYWLLIGAAVGTLVTVVQRVRHDKRF